MSQEFIFQDPDVPISISKNPNTMVFGLPKSDISKMLVDHFYGGSYNILFFVAFEPMSIENKWSFWIRIITI